MATLEQQRAQDAWIKAGEGIDRHGKDYVNDAKGLPALIMNSGLMQVMAYLHDKGGRHETLAQHVRDWLAMQCGTPRGFEDFMLHLFEMSDTRRFQAITAEAFAWLKWLRQMAAARKGGE
jgi:CRISPR-associated protein Cmr5